jgi:hypothetical protein
MEQHKRNATPESVSLDLQEYLAERQAKILPSGDQSLDGRRFTWCGDVLDFLIEGLVERFAARGITFTKPFPGPFRLMDEDQEADGRHVRRFWTVALSHGCPIAKLCTLFFHRHDQVALPEQPQVVGFPPDHQETPEATE